MNSHCTSAHTVFIQKYSQHKPKCNDDKRNPKLEPTKKTHISFLIKNIYSFT